MIARIARWRPTTLAERARRHHEAWLDRAVRLGGAYPRIPVRRVDQGGFDHVRRDHAARRWADTWWGDAFEAIDHQDHRRPQSPREPVQR